MGSIFSGDKFYFDEIAKGISSSDAYHDNSLNWDAEGNTNVNMVLEPTLEAESGLYIANEILDVDMLLDFDADENYAKYVDLLQLVPEKFRGSTELVTFLDEIGLQTGTWLGYINDLEGMLDKYTVGDDFIQNLAELVGYKLIGDASTMGVDEKRRQLVQVIDWYKMKGTYKTIGYFGYLLGFNLNFWDMYTNDYTTFVKKEWFTGAEGENPTDLTSDYYKSPHFGTEILLDTEYGDSGSTYLFQNSQFDNLETYIEKVRPINTVPHYSIFLNPITQDDGVTQIVSGNIKTATIDNWEYTRAYFDQNIAASAGDDLDFDDGNYWDESGDAFLNSITKYELGTGNKGIDPSGGGFAIASSVISGTIDSITIYSDRVEYEFEVTDSSQQEISELGLYLNDGTTLKLGATFPDISLDTSLTLRIVVVVYR